MTPTRQGSTYGKLVPADKVVGYMEMLVYGPPGTGKTTFVGSFPKPLIVASVGDRGTKVLRSRPETSVAPIETWEDVENLYYSLRSREIPCATIALDTVSGLQELALQKVTGNDIAFGASLRSRGEAAGLMISTIDMYHGLADRMNVVFVAHEKILKEDELKAAADMIQPLIGPSVSASVAEKMYRIADVIGHTWCAEEVTRIKLDDGKEIERKRSDFRMHLATNKVCHAKVRRDFDPEAGRGNEVPLSIANPTYKTIVTMMGGAK